MTRIIDVSKVQEALDNAARDALHGPRDVRAGRFVATDASVSLPSSKPRRMRPYAVTTPSTSTRRDTARPGKVGTK
jgi:hypothetical protein